MGFASSEVSGSIREGLKDSAESKGIRDRHYYGA